jgi:CheY-like chemotaxis protein
VTAVDDGRKAVETSRTSAFDVVLMDVQMPEVDGLTAAQMIRAREAGTGAHLPIIALTANAMSGDRERCLAAGMDNYISKPLQKSELSRALAALPRSTVRTD